MCLDDPLVDAHCHLDLFDDHVGAFRERGVAGVQTLAVTTTPRAWPRNLELAAPYPSITVALGLHPHLVHDLGAGELPIWLKQAETAFVIGEVGLDGTPRYYRSLPVQERVFREVLSSCAARRPAAISIHSAGAAQRVLDQLQAANLPPTTVPILHWFTGSPSQVRQAVGLGCYFSVNVASLVSPHGIRLLSAVPANRLLTETDAPFVTHLGRPFGASRLSWFISQLAQTFGTAADRVQTTVYSNFRTVLGDDKAERR